MQIAIYNQKGGAGKTMLSTQLALYFDATIVELDPYGMLTQTLENDRVLKLNLDEHVPSFTEGDVIYDFGGFDDVRLNQLNNLDLIIIPFQPTINALGTTLKSYHRVSKLNCPILFVINGYINSTDVTDAVEFISEQIGEQIEYFAIPHTRALQTAENSASSIVALSEAGGLKGHTYKKIASVFNEFFIVVENIIKK
jgi:cellulose biosynthesis protein BcsQ